MSNCWTACRATRRTPPTLVDGSVPAAIHRRTVRNETPDRRAISPARRCSRAVVICDRPVEVVVGIRAAPAFGSAIRGRIRAPTSARGRPARRSPRARSSQGMLRHAFASRPLTAIGGWSSHGQIVVNLATRRTSALCAPGSARHPRKVPVVRVCSPPLGSG